MAHESVDKHSQLALPLFVKAGYPLKLKHSSAEPTCTHRCLSKIFSTCTIEGKAHTTTLAHSIFMMVGSSNRVHVSAYLLLYEVLYDVNFIEQHFYEAQTPAQRTVTQLLPRPLRVLLTIMLYMDNEPTMFRSQALNQFCLFRLVEFLHMPGNKTTHIFFLF